MIFTRENKALWSLSNKLIFIFISIYFTLYCYSIFLGSLLRPIIYWIGKDILNITHEFSHKGYGSGDTTFAYIQVLFFLFLTVIATTVILIVDRKRPSYNTALWIFTILIRMILIYFMIVYGFSKIFYLQFSSPSLTRLLEPLGDMSPMGLAWTFMGYSKGYTIFSGVAEVIAGYLLISKRTQTFGAILTIAVMGNVFMMNLCYDIPVKLFSLHLLLMGLILTLTDFKRLLNVFLFNKATIKANYFSPYQHDKDAIRAIRGLKLVFAIGISTLFITNSFSSSKKRMEHIEKSNLYGIWEARYFINNNDTIPPLITDTKRWHYLIIEYKDRANVKTMTGKIKRYNTTLDTLSDTITFYKKDTTLDSLKYTYKTINKEYLELKGLAPSNNLNIIFYRKNLDNFLLKTRGFNWINERPLNK
jgi:hypothetical protein